MRQPRAQAEGALICSFPGLLGKFSIVSERPDFLQGSHIQLPSLQRPRAMSLVVLGTLECQRSAPRGLCSV